MSDDREENPEELDEIQDDDQILTCWCGTKGTAAELFDPDGLDSSCGGTGYVDCYCGGDQCVCHYHGQEVECPGCDECPDRDDEFDDCDPRGDEHYLDWCPFLICVACSKTALSSACR